MKSLTNQHWISLSGEPITGRIPPTLRIMNGVEPTPPQMGEIAHHYELMTLALKVSIIPYVVQERTLVDGTRVRMVSSYGVDTVMVWPKALGQRGGTEFIAFPAYVDISFSPIFDRRVIDLGAFTKPPYPKEPEFDIPRPEKAGSLFPKIAFSVTYGPQFVLLDEGGYPLGTFRNRTVKSCLVRNDGTPPGTHPALFVLEGSVTYAAVDGAWFETVVNAPRDVTGIPKGSAVETGVEYWSPASPSVGYDPREVVPGSVIGGGGYIPIISYMRSAYGNPYTVFVGNVPAGKIGTAVELNPDLFDAWGAAWEAGAAHDAAAEAAYQAAYVQWYADYAAWYDSTYQAWIDACKAIDDMYPDLGPYPGMASQRAAARELQLNALRGWLDGGIQDQPHLAARYLEFPWNIGTQPKNPLPTTGSVTYSSPVWSGPRDRLLEYTVNSADRLAVVPKPDLADPFDAAKFSRDTAHPLLRDMAMPRCLYGWTASGTYQLYATRFSWVSEPPQTRGVEHLTFSVRPGYDQFLRDGLVKAATKTARINSDGYVPPGTRITLVHLEYEVFDPFSGEWMWTPCFDIRAYDSLVLVSLGQYTEPPPPEPPTGSDRPRKVRVRKVQTQERLKDMSWGTPKQVSAEKLKAGGVWEKAVSAGSGANPCCIVIVEGIAKTAHPIEGGDLPTPWWSGNAASAKPLLQAAWDGNLYANILVVHALGITKKI